MGRNVEFKLPLKSDYLNASSSIKMGLNEKFKTVAQACAEEVIIPMKVGCCGFAGDRGFTYPKLNESALSQLKPSLPLDCKSGYSNSRTCEIGLSLYGKIDYQSIVYFVDGCTEKKPKPKELLVPEIQGII